MHTLSAGVGVSVLAQVLLERVDPAERQLDRCLQLDEQLSGRLARGGHGTHRWLPGGPERLKNNHRNQRCTSPDRGGRGGAITEHDSGNFWVP